MSIFDKSVECGICGETTGIKGSKRHKVSDGYICHQCFLAVGYTPGMVCFADTIENLKSTIEERKNAGITASNRDVYTLMKNASVASDTAHCPKCGCESISADKKGFGVGKAVVGAAVAGSIGLVAGNLGAKKVRITCLKCGHQWMAGK